VLTLAYRHIPASDTETLSKIDWNKESDVESDLVFVGLIGLIDPPRKEVAAAIAKCYRAGIRVCMITGDHQVTASSIAEKLGIVNPYGRAMRGVEIDLLAQEQALESLEPVPCVFARVSPENKLQIVEALQARREVVAMTGDGVNDAPAIKKSDVGVAMGISGTDITKSAASIVLRDDNFDTIARAVEEGRVIYDNIQKFILYLLSCNSAEIFLVLLAMIIGEETPMTTIQILWANIIGTFQKAIFHAFLEIS
jgi:P-type Ca2+ transporter type 2C